MPPDADRQKWSRSPVISEFRPVGAANVGQKQTCGVSAAHTNQQLQPSAASRAGIPRLRL